MDTTLQSAEEMKHQERLRYAAVHVLPLLPADLHPYCDCDSAEYQVRITVPGHAEFIVFAPDPGETQLTFYAAGEPWADLASALQAARAQVTEG